MNPDVSRLSVVGSPIVGLGEVTAVGSMGVAEVGRVGSVLGEVVAFGVSAVAIVSVGATASASVVVAIISVEDGNE